MRTKKIYRGRNRGRRKIYRKGKSSYSYRVSRGGIRL